MPAVKHKKPEGKVELTAAGRCEGGRDSARLCIVQPARQKRTPLEPLAFAGARLLSTPLLQRKILNNLTDRKQ